MSIQVLDDVVAGYEEAKSALKAKRVRNARTALVAATVEAAAPAAEAPGAQSKLRLTMAWGWRSRC